MEERKGGFNRTIKIIVKNKIIKSSVKETWEDVIDDVIGNRNISDELDAALDQGKFEVCLKTNTGPPRHFKPALTISLGQHSSLKRTLNM